MTYRQAEVSIGVLQNLYAASTCAILFMADTNECSYLSTVTLWHRLSGHKGYTSVVGSSVPITASLPRVVVFGCVAGIGETIGH